MTRTHTSYPFVFIVVLTVGFLCPSRGQAQGAKYLVVRTYLPVPKSATSGTHTMPSSRRGRGTGRPLWLWADPQGHEPLCRFRTGTVVRRTGNARKNLVPVQTIGSLHVAGYLPMAALGFRVSSDTHVLGSPKDTDVIGKISGGILVHVVRRRGHFALVNIMGYSQILVWIDARKLTTADATQASSFGYVSGATRLVRPGPIFSKPNGRIIARVPALSRVRQRQMSGKWRKIMVGDGYHVRIEGWVPSKRIRYGYYGVNTGGSSFVPKRYANIRGSQVATQRFGVYAQMDDAFPILWLEPGTRFSVSTLSDPRWARIVINSNGLMCRLVAPNNIGLWVPK